MKKNDNIIDNTKYFNEKLEFFLNKPFIVIDTEFIRENTFYPKLCLIQISNGVQSYCIDILSKNLDLSKFFKILSDENITKVFHAGKQDVEIFYNLVGFIPKPIFDTQIAIAFLGFPKEYSYNKLVNYYLNIDIDKTYQYSNWEKRPLCKEKIIYALNDVIYLSKIYPKIKKEIKLIKREKWLEEELSNFYTKENITSNSKDAWKKIKLFNIDNLSIYRVKKLSEWREDKAKNQNKLRKNILSDNKLLEICKKNPKNHEELVKILNRELIKNNYISDILNILNNTGNNKIENFNSFKKPNFDNNQIILKDLLKLFIKYTSKHFKISENFLATNSDIENFILSRDKSNKILNGWRYKLFGEIAEKIINGKIYIYLDKMKLKLKEI